MARAGASARYARHIAEALRAETVGGVIMLAAAVAALICANTGLRGWYGAFTGYGFGPSWFHLSTAHAAADGLLAVFFFIAGLELREELTDGELSDPRTAALPVLAATAGVIVPALLYVLVSLGEPGAGDGWAIPTATDIAFALAILAITYSRCPPGLRAFLLTLAVVDDMIAILVIALFYSHGLHPLPLVGGVVLIGVYTLLQRRGKYLVSVVAAVLAWALVYRSGVHATVAGIALGLLTDGRDRAGAPSAAERADHLVRPISAGLCVPVFAFVSAGVPLGGDVLGEMFRDRVALGVIVGLVIGKFLGVLGGAWMAVRLGLARLGDDLRWREIASVAVLAGVGFTVSLLINGLAYGGTARSDRVTAAVLAASVIAAAGAAVAFRFRTRERARHHVRQNG